MLNSFFRSPYHFGIGKVLSGDISVQRLNAFVDHIDKPAWLREERTFKFVCRSAPVTRSKHADRSIQVVEAERTDVCSQVVQERTPGGCITGNNDLAGLLHRGDHFFVVERYQRPGIDHFGTHAVNRLQLFCSLEGGIKCMSDGQERNVLTLSLHIGFSDRYLVISGWNTSLVELLADIVYALALKEDDRVGPLQCGIHQSLGIVGCYREADLDTRNMCHQRCPVLRVLCTIFRTHGDAEDNRHLQHVSTHCLPFGKLIEHLVATTSEEVAVHDLGNYPAATHCITDGRSNNGGLGDGRVEQAMVGKRLGHSAVNGKGTTPVAVLFTVCDKGSILVESVHDSFEDGIAQLELLHLAEGFAVGIEGKTL